MEIHRVGDDLRSCRACAAETVGMRSRNCQSKVEPVPGKDLRGDEEEKLDIPGPWIEL